MCIKKCAFLRRHAYKTMMERLLQNKSTGHVTAMESGRHDHHCRLFPWNCISVDVPNILQFMLKQKNDE